ncbi:hypothetical protein D9V29_11725 [Mycetocola manganoxydans]|uniref:DUF4878 domain-containing protein n=1 Tax=Mycetocola manganoxydans TaxID=699879 RepID=A0A3L6ZND3_9MICO|nr:hypothetical protein [Mycetocola manganoxydans]RLP69383.1 hypothetical protein D9V29_11725 [Mycetocola manganoxydans]GHD50766.1 hypothetical protein GCM10008097_25120 [Mycetocola manganoxydans]
MATDDKTPDPNNPEGTVPDAGSAETAQPGSPDQQAYTQGAAYAQGAYVQDPNAAQHQNPYGQAPAQNPYSQGQPQAGDNQGAQAAGAYTQGAYTQGAYTPGAQQFGHNQASQPGAYTQGAQQQPGAYNQGGQPAGYPQGATPAGYPPAAPRTPMDPKKKKKIILISAIAAGLVLLLIIGSIVINVVGSTQYGPEAKVKAYLSAISKGNASEANKLVEPGVGKDGGALLTNDVLKESKALMKNAKVTDVQTRGDAARVEISYSIDGTVYDGAIDLSKDGKQAVFFDNWKIDKPLLAAVYVYSNQGTTVSINGTDVDFGKEYEMAAYPAAYEVGAPKSDFFEAEAQTFIAATGSKASYESVELEMTPTDALTESIQKQVNAFLDTCAKETTPNPEDCNLRSNYYINFSGEPKFAYKVVKYPVITLNDTGTRFDAEDGQVSATATGELSYPGGQGTGTYTWDDWGISGNIVIDGDKATVEDLSGY